MNTYRAGDLVEISALERDAHFAVKVGEVYKIQEVDTNKNSQPYLLNTRLGGWWVSAGCLSLVTLENE